MTAPIGALTSGGPLLDSARIAVFAHSIAEFGPQKSLKMALEMALKMNAEALPGGARTL